MSLELSEINFYQVDGTVSGSIAPLLLKILDEKKRALIFCKNQVRIKETDDSLWSYGRNKFIPHSIASDREFKPERQPVLITNEEKNLNRSDYLIFLDEPSENFIKSFARIFYFFEDGKCATSIKPTNFYRKENGKWKKV